LKVKQKPFTKIVIKAKGKRSPTKTQTVCTLGFYSPEIVPAPEAPKIKRVEKIKLLPKKPIKET
jgi:hypothetical protein